MADGRWARRGGGQIAVFGVLASILMVPAVLAADGQVEPDWVAQYNGPDSDEDRVRDLVVRDGFVYVTGWTFKDYWRSFATVKYDASGTEIWSRVYEGFTGPNQPDEAAALAVDEAGNVFVTGWSLERVGGGGSFVDVATLKYDPHGELLWERRFRSPGGNNQPFDIEVTTDGAVYITGASWVGGGFDLMMLKYDVDGVLLWDRTIGRSGSRWDAGYALAVDSDGDVVTVGYTEPLVASDSAAYIAKFDASGNVLWTEERDGFSNVDQAERVVVDGEGNIYVLGEIAPPGAPLSIWTAMYDSGGNGVWEQSYAGTATMSNYAGGLALGPDGGVHVNGQSWDLPSTISIVTIKYRADGTLLWQRLEKAGYGNASGVDLAVDRLGSVYSTGFGYNGSNSEDFVTLKYEPDGNLAWTGIYADPHGMSDIPVAIAVDEALNVFVTGEAWVGFGNYFDITTIRYRQATEGDVNGDGDVNLADLAALLATYGTCAGDAGFNPAADFDDSGCVDLADLATLLANYEV